MQLRLVLKKKYLPPEQVMQTYTENYDEYCNTMLTDMEVDKVDNLILDNLLESPAMPEHPSVNAHQEINQWSRNWS